MDADKKIFIGLNSDDEERNLASGEYRDALNCRISVTEGASGGAVENIRGTLETNVEFVSTSAYTAIGAYERRDGTAISFINNNSEDDHRICLYDPSSSTAGDSEILLQNDPNGVTDILNFNSQKRITGVDMVGDDLFWTDNYNAVRHINVDRASRYNKAISVEIVFGVAETGSNVVFANTDTYSIDLFDKDGTSITSGPVLILTANGSYEDDIPAGVAAFVAAFNSNGTVNPYYTAEACGKSVVLTEITAGATTRDGLSPTVSVTTTSSAPVSWFYQNVYPLAISDHIISLAKYPPVCAPVVSFVKDSTRQGNFVNRSVFQFQYRYVYTGNYKSAWGPISDVAEGIASTYNNYDYNAIEVNFTDAYLSDQNIMNEIVRVDVGVREHNTGDLRLVKSIPRNEVGLHKAFIYFYNDQDYPVVDTAEATKLYDSVPIRSRSLISTLQNNNSDQRLMLGGNLEGYDNVCIDADVSGSMVAIPDCAGRYTLEFSIKLENTLRSVISTVHHHEDNVYPTFGGIEPAGDYVNSVGSDYQQYLPEGGFVGYLAGTDYFAISTQDEHGAISAYTDSNKNIYDSSSVSLRNDIEAAITTGSVRQRISIPNVKPGRYVIRLASHWCSYGDKLGKGAEYDLDNNRRYQTTSTYVSQINTGGGAVDGREIIVNLPHISTGSTATVNAGEFTVLDLTYPVLGSSSDAVQGYIIDADGSSDFEDLQEGTRMEKRIVNLYDATVGSIGVTFSDHNGFWFYTQTGIASFVRMAVEDQAGNETISSRYSFNYIGGLKELSEGILVKEKNLITSGTNGLAESIVWNENVGFRETYATYITGRVIDSVTSVPVMGMNVVVSGVGRVSRTDHKGEYRILAYTDGVSTAINGSINYSNESLFCMTIGTSQVTLALTGMGTTYTQATVYRNSDLSVTVSSFTIINTRRFKRGDRLQFGIVYYDASGRSGFVNTADSMAIDIPWWEDTTGDSSYNLLWTINHIPPIWATHYQILRTKSQIYQDYRQLAVGQVRYVAGYDSSSDTPDYVNYGDQAQEVHLSMDTLIQFSEDNAGSRLSYQYVEGDRIRLIRDHDGEYYSELYDYAIKSQRGGDLVIAVSNDIPELKEGVWIEVYTPRASTDTKIYYEVDLCFEIGNPGLSSRYHKGPLFNQTPGSVPAAGQIYLGNSYLRRRRMFSDDNGRWEALIESPSMSDFFLSNDEGIGRVNAVNPDAIQLNRHSHLRFSNPYSSDANVNKLSQFEALNGVSFPPEYGNLEKLIWVNNVMLAIFNIETVSIYVNETVISDTSGSQNLLAIGDNVLGYWRHLDGGSGTYHPESVVEADGQAFWYDFGRSRVSRYGGNGIVAISDVKMIKHFRDRSTYMDKSVNGAAAPATFDRKYREYVLTMNYDDVLPADTIVWNDEANRWASITSCVPEYYCRTDGDRLLGYFDGKPFLMNEGLEYNNFFGGRYSQSITVVGNVNPELQKTFMSMAIHGNFDDASLGLWRAEIAVKRSETGVNQASELIGDDFVYRNGEWRAGFLRDVNTPGATDPLLNGDRLQGKTIKIKLTNDNYDFVIIEMILIFSNPDNLAIPR